MAQNRACKPQHREREPQNLERGLEHLDRMGEHLDWVPENLDCRGQYRAGDVPNPNHRSLPFAQTIALPANARFTMPALIIARCRKNSTPGLLILLAIYD